MEWITKTSNEISSNVYNTFIAFYWECYFLLTFGCFKRIFVFLPTPACPEIKPDTDPDFILSSYNTSIDTQILIGCKKFGYRLEGPYNVTCLDNRTWSENLTKLECKCRSMSFYDLCYNLLKRHNIYISSIVKLTLIWCSPVNVISRNKKKYSDSIIVIILRVYIDCYCTFDLHEFCIFIVRGIII